MGNRLAITFAILFPVVAVMQQQPRQHVNRSPSIDSFTSSLTRIHLCPFSNQPEGRPEVELVVNATDPDGDSLSYEYSTKEGTISGSGKSVVWDLSGLPLGPHEVRVTVTDEKGGKANSTLTVTTVVAGVCDPPPPRCPVVKVSCADEIDKSRPFTFSAIIEGDHKGYAPPNFSWEVNAGKIVKGQDTREIEVSAQGANGFEGITATVQVGGFDPLCITVAACTTKIVW